MAVATTEPQTSYDGWGTRRWLLTGRLLVLGWLVAVLAIVLVGERRSDLGSLHGALADGSVSRVEVSGLPAGGVRGGFATVRLHWRSGLLHRYTEIVVVSPGRTGRGAQDLPVVVGDPLGTLTQLRPDVEIVREARWTGASWESGGWSLRGWAGVLIGPLFLLTLFVLVGGPQPWRATRWAWLWLIVAHPFGALAYALLGGPLALAAPVDRARRLTGGWAFLIGMFLSGGPDAG